MNKIRKNILIHHHSLAFQEGNTFWLQSFFGAWVSEIAKHFDTVGVIAETTSVKENKLDYNIVASNIVLHSFGERGKMSRSERKSNIVSLGKKISSNYDYLIIRGITPRQFDIYSAFKRIPRKSFLLVGSLIDNKAKFGFSKLEIIVWFLSKIRILELKKISKASQMFANSPTVVDELKTVLNIDSEFVPTNTISINDFMEFKIKEFRPNPELLFCGRVIKEKGIEELIESVSELRKQGIFCSLRIIGPIIGDYKIHLEKMCIHLGVSDFVIFQGFVRFGTTLLEFYRKADIYILPSAWQEGFPHTIWESNSSCTPVITTRIGGIPGIISESEVCFINPKSVAEITNAVKLILSQKEYSNSLIKNGYYFAQKFTVENCVMKLNEKMTRE